MTCGTHKSSGSHMADNEGTQNFAIAPASTTKRSAQGTPASSHVAQVVTLNIINTTPDFVARGNNMNFHRTTRAEPRWALMDPCMEWT